MTIGDLFEKIETILQDVIRLLFLVATVVFLWGIIQYVIAGGDEEKIKTAKVYIISGIIGLFVMVAMWGIVKGLCLTFFGTCQPL